MADEHAHDFSVPGAWQRAVLQTPFRTVVSPDGFPRWGEVDVVVSVTELACRLCGVRRAIKQDAVRAEQPRWRRTGAKQSAVVEDGMEANAADVDAVAPSLEEVEP